MKTREIEVTDIVPPSSRAFLSGWVVHFGMQPTDRVLESLNLKKILLSNGLLTRTRYQYSPETKKSI